MFLAVNQHFRMTFEESCDAEDWRNSALCHRKKNYI